MDFADVQMRAFISGGLIAILSFAGVLIDAIAPRGWAICVTTILAVGILLMCRAYGSRTFARMAIPAMCVFLLASAFQMTKDMHMQVTAILLLLPLLLCALGWMAKRIFWE